MADPRLVVDVNAAEGRKNCAYKDPLGNWTAGVGHLLPRGIDFTNICYSNAQVDVWLAADLENARLYALALAEWPHLYTVCRQNAVIELVFNMGIGTYREFVKMRAAMVVENWTLASIELLSSTWAKQVGFGRARRIASYLLNGYYPPSPVTGAA
jgi:GH24 family phage-related lysozyme (muramidase)